MAFWGLSRSVYELYEITNSNLVVLKDNPVFEENDQEILLESQSN
jgi:hypothetical protein